MASLIHYERETADKAHDKIGGSALLPESIAWPADRFGNHMLFLGCLSSALIHSMCNIIIPDGHVLSVFCPYKKDDINYPLDMARGREPGYVCSHFAAAPRQAFDDPIAEARELALNTAFETDEDEFTDEIEDKIGGQPNWLQDRMDYTGYRFVMQLSGLYFDKVVPTHKGMFNSGVLYIFFDPESNTGKVALQYS